MDPERRHPPLDPSLPDDSPQPIRTLELRQHQTCPPHLERGVRVRAGRTWQVMLTGERHRQPVGPRSHAAGIENFDGIHQRDDFQQILQLPMTAAPRIERVRHADERSLVAQTFDGFSGREARRHFLGHVSSQEFAARGHDLLADDYPLGVKPLRYQRPGDGIVVGDDEAVNPPEAAGLDEGLGGGEGIWGGGGVGVKVEEGHQMSLKTAMAMPRT